MADMRLYLGGTQLPKFSEFQEINTPNATEVRSLDATLNVDYVNYTRGWKATWKFISYADYQTLINKFRAQFTTSTLFQLLIPGLGISTPVYMKVSETNIRFSGNWVEDFSVEFYEQNAIS